VAPAEHASGDAADRLLTAEEVAGVLGMTKRRAPRLPFSRRISVRSVRYSEAGLKRWMAHRHVPKSQAIWQPAVLSSSEEAERRMNVTIPKSLEAFVREKVEEGQYSTEDEVVADALRLMQARDEVAQLKRARLKDAIDRGYEDVAAGRVSALENDDQVNAFFREL
jgi:antitoxin ParD1/3/4